MGENMKWLFLACYFCICHGQADAYQDQIEQIDAQIKELKEMKRGYNARAIRAEDQADRLQFEDHFVLETRRYYRIAEENRAKAAKIQEEIDRLEAQESRAVKKSSANREEISSIYSALPLSDIPSMRMRLRRDVSPDLDRDARF